MERINYRQMKADMGMDAPETRASLRRYESFKELAGDIEHLVDMLWASSTRQSDHTQWKSTAHVLTGRSVDPSRRTDYSGWNAGNVTPNIHIRS